jgi:hypothetical protein
LKGTERDVAVKILRGQYAEDEEFVERPVTPLGSLTRT